LFSQIAGRNDGNAEKSGSFLGQTSISYLPFHPALNGCIPVVFQLMNARVFFFCSSNRKTEGN